MGAVARATRQHGTELRRNERLVRGHERQPFLRRCLGERFRDPSARIVTQLHATTPGEDQKLPSADRRDPEFVFGAAQGVALNLDAGMVSMAGMANMVGNCGQTRQPRLDASARDTVS